MFFGRSYHFGGCWYLESPLSHKALFSQMSCFFKHHKCMNQTKSRMLSLSPPFKDYLSPLSVGQTQGSACFSVYKQDLQRTQHNRISSCDLLCVLYHLVTYIETLRDKNPETMAKDTSAPSNLGTLRRIQLHFPPPYHHSG